MGSPPELEAELAFHIEMQTRRYEAAGMDRAEARERALRRIGNLDRAREECLAITAHLEVDMRRADWRQGLRQDIVYALRALRRTPVFAATALLTIALGIGANTAIFSVIDAVLLRSLPYPHRDRLFLIWNGYSQAGLSRTAVAAAEFADIRDRNQTLDGVAALRPQSSSLTGDCGAGTTCEPERIQAYVVSPNLFDLLGASPSLGRPFVDTDGAAGAEKVVLLSESLWRRRFAGEASIVGRTIHVAGIPRTVVGVMPRGTRFPDAPLGFLKNPADLWIPYGWEQSRTDGRGNQNLAVLARARQDVSLARAQSDLDRIADGFRTEYPARYARPEIGWRIQALPLRDQAVGDVRPTLLIVLGAVGLVLLIACANVANLILARGVGRKRELAVRSALGAGRARLIRQILIETGTLVTIGGALGGGLSVLGVRLLVGLDPGNIPLLQTAAVNATVVSFALAITAITAILVGVVPAIRQSGIDPQLALAGPGRSTSADAARRKLRSLLVIAEVAMAAVVLVGAGLVIRSFVVMARVETGISADGAAVVQLPLPRTTYNTTAKIHAFHQAAVVALASLPGVTAASGVYPLPMSGEHWSGTLIIEEHPSAGGQPDPHAEYAVALPHYFSSLGIPLIAGRDFADADAGGAPSVAIVDDLLAKHYWPGQSAVGKRLSPGGPPADNAWTTIVGVVGHVRNAGPRDEGEWQVYRPALQTSESLLYYVARADQNVAGLPRSMREAIRAIDPSLPVGTIVPMRDIVARATARERFQVTLLGIFGVVALTLAAVGLYGVISFLVGQRTREIGIRLALGGRPDRVMRSILGEGLVLTATGLILGLLIALVLSRTMTGLLFGVEPTDPATYGAIAALLVVVTIAASYVPARRASRVDPAEVLRN